MRYRGFGGTLVLCGLLFCFLPGKPARGQLKKAPPNEYPTVLTKFDAAKGLPMGRGAIYLTVEDGDGILKAEKAKGPLQIQIHFYCEKTKKFHALLFPYDLQKRKLDNLWTLAEGSYQPVRVSMLGRKDRNFSWVATFAQAPFQVKAGHIANFGTWTMRKQSKPGLMDVGFAMKPQPIEISDLMKQIKGAVVLNARNGLQQKMPKYRSQLEITEEPFNAQEAKLAEYRYSRKISLKYDVNLFRDNNLKSSFQKTLRLYEEHFKQCYNYALDSNEHMKGQVMFTFSLSKETSSLKNIRAQKNDIGNEDVLGCLSDELAHISFSMQKDLLGVVVLNFNVKEKISM